MKKIVYTLLLISLFCPELRAQGEWVSGSIDQGSQSNSVALYIQTTQAFDANKCDNLVFTVRIPVSAGSQVELAELYHASAFQHLAFSFQKLNVSDGAFFYYIISGTGSILAAAGQTITAGSSFKVLELGFSGGGTGVIELVNLENDLPGNIFIRPQFYIQTHVGDITRYSQIFYGSGAAVVVNNAPVTGDDWVTTSSLVLLPVSFLSFNAEARGMNGYLTWAVSQETAQTEKYSVERSLDGQRFETIGNIPARRSNGTNQYIFSDAEVGRIAGQIPVLYRIRQLDTDGRQVLSGIESIRFDKQHNLLAVYPNPTTGSTTVSFTAASSGPGLLSILTDDGKTVYSRTIMLTPGLNKLVLSLEKFSAGTYQLILTENNTRKSVPFIKR